MAINEKTAAALLAKFGPPVPRRNRKAKTKAKTSAKRHPKRMRERKPKAEVAARVNVELPIAPESAAPIAAEHDRKVPRLGRSAQAVDERPTAQKKPDGRGKSPHKRATAHLAQYQKCHPAPAVAQNTEAVGVLREADRTGTGVRVARKLIRLCLAPGIQASVRLAAIREYLDRVSGRPTQSVVVSASIDDRAAAKIAAMVKQLPQLQAVQVPTIEAEMVSHDTTGGDSGEAGSGAVQEPDNLA